MLSYLFLAAKIFQLSPEQVHLFLRWSDQRTRCYLHEDIVLLSKQGWLSAAAFLKKKAQFSAKNVIPLTNHTKMTLLWKSFCCT